MRKLLFFIAACCISIANADAVVRGTDTVNRTAQQNSTEKSSNVIARAGRTITTTQTNTTKNTIARTADTNNTISRTATPQKNVTNEKTRNTSVSRAATTIARNNTTTPSTATTSRGNSSVTVARSGTVSRASIGTTQSGRTTARNTTVAPASVTNTFGTEYNQCRNAYFTCMDQFCATANDSYRRCVCSSRLTEIQERERALSQASGQLQDFHNLNIEVIPKTADEVKAMLTASEGELAAESAKDTSDSAAKLTGIRDVLSSAKSQSLSTLGTLDIAGDINQIWATTNLASGENIANLTGEALYNAVHSQCADLVSPMCSASTFDMVVSAYGMYIENDCSALTNALNSQLTQANSTIRDTEREMNVARLENYNAHNSTSINDCIAQVRADITADNACGTDYVHCLDITGLYLNRDTGEPIYTPDFYQLEHQISLDGDVLTNSTNRLIVAELNRKRIFAERGLETCRDIADQVWDEFLRQAIVEIYQGQQQKVRAVKDECMNVVNICYDTQSEQLKDYVGDLPPELLTGSRLELSETLCEEKLYACSNLYGEPSGNGLELLLVAMHDLTDQKIAAECRSLLEVFAQDTCTVSNNDTLHSYPYGCRVYAPGDAIYATKAYCNRQTQPGGDQPWTDTGDDHITIGQTGYVCARTYVSCNSGYYMATKSKYATTWVYDPTPTPNNRCRPCPEGCDCPGGSAEPQCATDTPILDADATDCGDDYIGSLYQQMVKYATQVCIRPSEYDAIVAGYSQLPQNVLQDVNVVMDSIRADMASELSKECERLGGIWVNTPWVDEINNKYGTPGPDKLHDKTGQQQFKYFYDETGSNTKWGFCAEISAKAVSNAYQSMFKPGG